MSGLRIPPGRAGRLWLRERLDIAETAVSLLQQKQALLEQRLRELRAQRAQTGRVWETACRDARAWQVRAVLAGGQHSLDAAASRHPAVFTTTTATVVGVHYPAEANCALPEDFSGTLTISAVVVGARRAHGAALVAAARHAADVAAVDRIEHQLSATRLRAQALRRRRLPTLRRALAALELELAEQERAEHISLIMWAPGRE
jgi:V/A-type H+/Na+-transporting ATPase subunit D